MPVTLAPPEPIAKYCYENLLLFCNYPIH